MNTSKVNTCPYLAGDRLVPVDIEQVEDGPPLLHLLAVQVRGHGGQLGPRLLLYPRDGTNALMH